jgi:hypothetical protein
MTRLKDSLSPRYDGERDLKKISRTPPLSTHNVNCFQMGVSGASLRGHSLADEISHQPQLKRRIQSQSTSMFEINNSKYLSSRTENGPLENVFSEMHLKQRVYTVNIADLKKRIFKAGYGNEMYDSLVTVYPSITPTFGTLRRFHFTCTRSSVYIPSSQRHDERFIEEPIDCKENTLIIVEACVNMNDHLAYVVNEEKDNSNHVICVTFYRMSIKDKWEASLFDANLFDNEISKNIELGRSAYTHNGVIPGAEEVMDNISEKLLGVKVKWRVGQIGLHDREQLHPMVVGDGICYLTPCIIIALMGACNSELPTNGARLMHNVNRALDNINKRPGALCQIVESIYLGKPVPRWVCLKRASDPVPISFVHWMRSTVTGHSSPEKRDLTRVKTKWLKNSWEKQRLNSTTLQAAKAQRMTLKKVHNLQQSPRLKQKRGTHRLSIPYHLQRLDEE